MDVPYPGIKVNVFYETYNIVGRAYVNRHHILLVISKVFQTQPWFHNPKNIYNCRNSTKLWTLLLHQLYNLLKIAYRKLLVQIVVSQESCACIINKMFGTGGILWRYLVQPNRPHWYSCQCYLLFYFFTRFQVCRLSRKICCSCT